MADPNVLDPEVVDDAPTALELRHPSVPTTLDQLAVLRGEAMEIIDARIQILETARLRAVRMTHPEDWVLFKGKDERIVGYLQDSGCERVRRITGISITNVEEPEKVIANDGQTFAVVIRGRGECQLTGEILERVEGIRESTEDFCKDLRGIKQELRVRQAARANLDGRIVRELAGLGSVPIAELERAWTGTDKKVEHCRKGRGFGSQDERLGAAREGAPDVPPPMCPECKIPLIYRQGKGDRGGFYGCKNYEKHPNVKVIVDAGKWVEQQKAATGGSTAQGRAAAATSTAPADSSSPASKAKRPEPMQAGDIFGGREPGSEG